MAVPVPPVQPVRFGDFVLDLQAGQLRKHGLRIKLQEQPFQILVMMLERPGEVVTREELRQRLWPSDTFVDFDHGLNNAINRLREALNDSAEAPRFIETLPRKGYSFIAKVNDCASTASQSTTLSEFIETEDAKVARGQAVVTAKTSPAPSLHRVKRLVAACAGISAALILWIYLDGERPMGINAARIQSVAVLPLDNLSGDPAQEYFAAGMTEELTTQLGKISSLRVVSRTSAQKYHAVNAAAPQIARELKVDAIVEGSVLRFGNRVRITTQLIDAAHDKHLWAESYERDIGDVLAVQNTVALEIARQVRARLTSGEQQRLEQHAPVNPGAYDAYLRGRYSQTTQTADGLKDGLPAFQQAINLDPTYAPAYAGLADTYSLLANYQVLSPSEAFPQAAAAARKSLQLDPALAEAHVAAAYPEHHFTWEWPVAEREYKTAIMLNPSYANAHSRYAEYLSSMGRHEEAIAEMRRAMELDPLSLVYTSNLGRFLYHARRYDEAIEVLKQTLALDPNRVYARVHLAMSYEEKGMYAESLQEWKTITPSFGGRLGPGWAHFYARTGQQEKAKQIVERLRREAGDSDWFLIAGVYASLGQKDAAFACLERAYSKHDFFLVFLAVHPYMDPLRSDPHYSELVRRMGFEFLNR